MYSLYELSRAVSDREGCCHPADEARLSQRSFDDPTTILQRSYDDPSTILHGRSYMDRFEEVWWGPLIKYDCGRLWFDFGLIDFDWVSIGVFVYFNMGGRVDVAGL